MADYGVYTLAEIFNQVYGHLPSSPSELAPLRSAIEGLGGMPASKTWNEFYMPNDFFSSVSRDAVSSLTVPSSSASSAWELYTGAGNAVNQLGSATQGGQLVKGVDLGYYRIPTPSSPTGYTYNPAVMLKMPLPTIAAAVAPLAGVSIGASMYQENPELWTRLSRALIPWAYPDGPDGGPVVDASKGLMPVWTEVGEAAGELIARALLPATLVDAIKQFFVDEGIGEPTGTGDTNYGGYDGYSGGGATLTSRSGAFNDVITISSNGPVVVFAAGTGHNSIQVFGTSPIAVHIENFRNGNLVSTRNVYSERSGSGYIAYGFSTYGPASGAIHGNPPNDYEALFRSMRSGGTPTPGGYPEGLSRWGTGAPYPLPSSPNQIALQDEDGNYRFIDAYPIPIPVSPGESISPETQEIDDPLPDIPKQVDPYIDQSPEPYSPPAPSPDPPGQPSPTADPSQRSEPSNPLEPGPTTPTPPPSGGQSPDPEIPEIPLPFTNEGGLIAVYNPPQSTLVAFARWLWVTYQDATIQKIWNNPFDGVISLHELYCTPPVVGSRSIRSGFLDSGITSPIIERYTEINCGSIVIPEYWGNYLDYAPYTKAFVYLPFIGIIELEADDIVGHAVNITYRIDCYNGSCIAMITVAKRGPDGTVYNNTVYQYSGNCAVELPLSGGSQANIKAAIINATAWGLGSVITGLVTAAGQASPIAGLAGAGQAISGALQATASVVNAKSSVQHSGTFGASFGAMGIKKPYIIIKRPIQVQVLNYNEIYGYQAHKAVTIGACEGYLRCREVHVTSATANDEEKQLIEQYLKTGVIV